MQRGSSLTEAMIWYVPTVVSGNFTVEAVSSSGVYEMGSSCAPACWVMVQLQVGMSAVVFATVACTVIVTRGAASISNVMGDWGSTLTAHPGLPPEPEPA